MTPAEVCDERDRSQKYQSNNKVSKRWKYSAKLKENIPPAARDDTKWRGVAWCLPWMGINRRWLGE